MERPFRQYHKFSTCDIERDLWPTLKNFYIGHDSFVLGGKAFIFGLSVPFDKAFRMYHNLKRVTFDLLLKNFKIGHNFFIQRDRVFMFDMCVSYNKAFQTV